MIKLVINHLNSFKNKIIISISLILLIIIHFLIVDFDILKTDYILFYNQYKTYYNSVIYELYKIIIPTLMVFLLVDHDQSYLNDLSLYIGSSKMLNAKRIVYIFIAVNILILLFIIYIVSLSLLGIRNIISIELIKKMKFLFLDMILTVNLCLLLVNIESKMVAYLIVFIYLVLNFTLNNNSSIIFYYLIPFHYDKYSNYQYKDLYFILYNLFLILINN